MTRQGSWYWTPERVVAAIQVFAEVYGRQPSYTDFNPSRAQREAHKRFHEDGCWPTGATVFRHWGSWNAAIEAAGFTPIRPGTQENPEKHKDTCKNGHEFTPENTRWRTHKDGRRQRVCRECNKAARRAAYDRHHKGPGSRASRGMPPSDHPKWKEPVG